MAVAFALGAALAYGSADFMGGLASRRTRPLVAALGAQIVGLVVLLVVLPFLGPTHPTVADMAFGALAGVFGGTGLVAVFKALARGPMGVVAPVTALAASVVPIVAGLLAGERPGILAAGGMAVSFVAVMLLTRERKVPGVGRAVPFAVVLTALGGGAIFGLFFVALHHTNASAGLWPLVSARVASIALLGAMAGGPSAARSAWSGAAAKPLLVSGALDMGANVLYLLAIRHGMLTVVAAVAGLYPASTVLLARTHLGERLRPIQIGGLGVATVAALLLVIA